jgi:hypothetical protein
MALQSTPALLLPLLKSVGGIGIIVGILLGLAYLASQFAK